MCITKLFQYVERERKKEISSKIGSCSQFFYFHFKTIDKQQGGEANAFLLTEPLFDARYCRLLGIFVDQWIESRT